MAVKSKLIAVGSTAPDFTLPTTNGGDLSLIHYRNISCVILVFLRGFMWPFCRRHLRQLTAQYKEFRSAGADIIALVRDTQQAAHDYFQKHHIPFPCLVDIYGDVYHQYEVKSKLLSFGQRPALFVIDREGIVRYAYLGSQQWEIPSNEDVLKVIRNLPCWFLQIRWNVGLLHPQIKKITILYPSHKTHRCFRPSSTLPLT